MKTSHLYFIYSRRFYIFAGHKYIQKYKMTVFCAFEAEKPDQKHRSARFCAFKAEKAGQKHKTARFCAFTGNLKYKVKLKIYGKKEAGHYPGKRCN